MKKENIKENPYYWLESNSTRTRKWIAQQEKEEKKYFSDTDLSGLNKRFSRLIKVDSMLAPTQRGNLYFYRYRKPNEEEHSFYVKEGIQGKPKLLINIPKISKRMGSVHGWKVSPDGKYIVIEFSLASNDKCSLRIFDVKNKKFSKDYIRHDRYPFFAEWNHDSSGFWYIAGAEGNSPMEEKYNKRLYYHQIGTPTSKDALFFGNDLKDKLDIPFMKISEDGRYGVVNVIHKDKRSTSYFCNLTDLKPKFTNVTKEIRGKSSCIIRSGFIYLKTDFNAPNGKILRRQIYSNKLGRWEIFIPQSKYVITGWKVTSKKMFVEYMQNVASRLYAVDVNSKKKSEVKLPGIGTIESVASEFGSNELFFGFSSFNFPHSLYKLDIGSLKYSLLWRSSAPVKVNEIVVKQEWYKSQDGTRVPMFIVHKKGVKLNGTNPTLVYAYGGFNVALQPHFNITSIPFIEDGGIYAVVNIRGGSEFGNKWHESALLKKRHKCFEDFAYALKHLTHRKYTNPSRIAIWGGSNGGLLMCVMMLKYFRLFRIALVSVPVTDMLRYHLFYGGRWWIHEYGDPDDKKMRQYLLKYSPYHNVEDKNYPPSLFLTSDNDDRVHPMHSYKMVARLKANRKQKNPIILNIQRKSGHSGAGKISPVIDRLTHMFAFVYKELDI